MLDHPPQTALKETVRRGAAPITNRTRTTYLGMIGTARNASISKRTTDWEMPALVSMTQVIEDYFSRDDLAASTLSTMRAALLWFIKSGQAEDNDDTRKALLLLEQTKTNRGRPNTSKPKTIPEGDLIEILEDLYGKAQKSAWSYRTAIWIRAGLASGARPIEWLHAEWATPEKTQLKLRNAKIKLTAPAFIRRKAEIAAEMEAGMAPAQLESLQHWEISPENDTEATYRLVPIDAHHDREVIDRHLEALATIAPHHLSILDREDSFKIYYDTCRRYIDRSCRKLWDGKKRYSLYTMRGQFSANMKAAKGADFTAEVMGHTSVDTPSAANYGKYNQAHPMYRGTRKSPITERLTQAPHEAGEPGNGPSAGE